MKTGDLILLSAAGRERSGNWRCRVDGGFGIIETTNGRGSYPIEVIWWTCDMSKSFSCRFKRYEIKKFCKNP